MAALTRLASWLFASIGAAEGLVSRHQAAVAVRSACRQISIPGRFINASRRDVSPLPDGLSLGTLMAYEPASPANGDLLLFLAGSGRACSFYSEFLEVVGSKMRTLCVPYDNREAVAKRCLLIAPCYRRLRMQALDGTMNNIPQNNIEGRVVSALQYLSRTDGPAWGKYLDATSGLPLWPSFRVAGHSQGAGNAAWIGYHREVARVVQFSGTCDLSDWTRREGPPATLGSRFFGLGHALDGLCSLKMQQAPGWRDEGALTKARPPLELNEVKSLSGVSLGGAQTVFAHAPSPACRRSRMSATCRIEAHDSVVADVWDGERSPYASGVWQALVGI